jgi:hypothetical protein
MEGLVLFGRDWGKVHLFYYIVLIIKDSASIYTRFKHTLEREMAIQFEATLKSTLLKCFEIKFLYQIK